MGARAGLSMRVLVATVRSKGRNAMQEWLKDAKNEIDVVDADEAGEQV